MPIPRKLFEKGLDPLDTKIIKILDSDPDNAYSVEELIAKLGFGEASFAERLDLLFRLRNLVLIEEITSGQVHGTAYYTSAKQPRT